MTKAVIFPSPGYEGYKLFHPHKNNWEKPFIELANQLEDAGYTVDVWPCEVNKQNDVGIYLDMPAYPCPTTDRSLLITLEPPVVKPRQYERWGGLPYTRKLTFVKELCDDKYTFYSPFPIVPYKGPATPQRDKNCVAITTYITSDHPGALYKARELAYLSMGQSLDLYGRNWHKWEGIQQVNYLGEYPGHKVELMMQYKQAIVFENCEVHGYTSEKYWDAIQAGVQFLYRGSYPDYQLEDAAPKAWAKRILEHLEKV